MHFKTPSGANFSRCRRYRYTLWRIWDPKQQPVMMIGLNPSTADAQSNDPTIRRCIGFARDWDAGGLIMTNLFAFRATYPTDLKRRRSRRPAKRLVDTPYVQALPDHRSGLGQRGHLPGTLDSAPKTACRAA